MGLMGLALRQENDTNISDSHQMVPIVCPSKEQAPRGKYATFTH